MKVGDYEFGSRTVYNSIRKHIYCPGSIWDWKFYYNIGKKIIPYAIDKEMWNRQIISKRIEYVNSSVFGIDKPAGRILIVSIGNLPSNLALKPMYLITSVKKEDYELLLFLPDEEIRKHYISNPRNYNFPDGFFHYSDTILVPVVSRKGDTLSQSITSPPQILANYGKHEKIRKIDLISGL